MRAPRLAVAASALATLAAASLQPRRLRVVNGCGSEPLWVAHMAGAGTGPDPQNVRIEPLASHDFLTSDGLSATRYWPKAGCDAQGNNCTIGESGGPGQGCVVRTADGWDDYSRCAPPVDTKFEASFGTNGEPCNPAAVGGTEMRGCDYVDISMVDGFTLPVKLELDGECTDSRKGSAVEVIDCSELSMDACPADELLTAANRTFSLKAVNPSTRNVSGCYSPCQRLLDTKWSKEGVRLAEGPEAALYCCPTPPVGAEQCRAGPILATQFLDVVHTKCRGAYSYAYDDSNGLLRCSSSTRYVLTFYCPAEYPARESSGPHNGTDGGPQNGSSDSSRDRTQPARGFLQFP